MLQFIRRKLQSVVVNQLSHRNFNSVQRKEAADSRNASVIGSIILMAYGVIPTLQTFPSFGRVYAAYGGVFVILAVLWGWLIDKKTPDLYDWIGAAVCLIGVSIMLWAPRS
jgi:drug/metabolite transporter superfamily protein YnfA